MLGLDYAGSSPGAAAVKAAGYGFVARYLSRYSSKTIKKPEYDDMTGNGVGVVLVFEDYANQALQGYNQGVADAQVALAQANALGWPQNRPIHFAVDFDISPAQKPVAGEYMKGVASVIGLARTAPYGGYWWVKYCFDNGLCGPFAWQAVAWSGGNIDSRATLFQQLGGTTVNGTACDVNRSLKDDFGQNNGKGNEDMISAGEVAQLRIGHSEIGGWPFAETHQGKFDQQFIDAWQGHTWQEFIYAQWLAGGEFRDKRVQEMADYPNLASQITDLNTKLTTAQQTAKDAQAAQAKAEAALKVLQDQTNTDTQTGNSFLRWLGGILSKMKGTK